MQLVSVVAGWNDPVGQGMQAVAASLSLSNAPTWHEMQL
jgi:hypothetical protein